MSRSCNSPSQHGITATIARYLVVIHELASAQGTATVRGIAIVLDISNPSATNMIKRLRAKGLVADRETRAITLSDHGEHIARIQIERVGLVQRHLIDAFGYAPADSRRRDSLPPFRICSCDDWSPSFSPIKRIALSSFSMSAVSNRFLT